MIGTMPDKRQMRESVTQKIECAKIYENLLIVFINLSDLM